MASPITHLTTSEQQHMLFLFLPVKSGKELKVGEALTTLKETLIPVNDIRATTGVHFFMFYHLPAGQSAGLPIPSFQAMDDRGLFVVQAIYDNDFQPYIKSFVDNPAIAFGLNIIVDAIDERGIVDPADPTSAVSISSTGGVANNAAAFNCLLMRYNFSDPTIPASTKASSGLKFTLGFTFPGLTIGKILANYPEAGSLWPLPLPDINFDPSEPPTEC